jgi:radical SAM protein with 4Fe4S-binding SPASM domain
VINAIRMLHIDRIGMQFYDPREAEVVCIVDTDGGLHSNGDAYDTRLCHGNIFEQGLDEMRNSSGYRLSIDGSVDRIAATCASCKFHGACSGFYMGQATPEQRIYEDGKLVCSVAQPVQDYVLSRLRDPSLYEAMMARSALSAATPQLDHPEM